jgi:hypothetical protein
MLEYSIEFSSAGLQSESSPAYKASLMRRELKQKERSWSTCMMIIAMKESASVLSFMYSPKSKKQNPIPINGIA